MHDDACAHKGPHMAAALPLHTPPCSLTCFLTTVSFQLPPAVYIIIKLVRGVWPLSIRNPAPKCMQRRGVRSAGAHTGRGHPMLV
jgi:hypothetical protein